MTALLKIHSHYGIAGIEQSKENGKIGVCTAVRLNVDVFRSEKLLGSVACDLLNNIDALTSAVVSLRRVALCIFVSEHSAGGKQNRF